MFSDYLPRSTLRCLNRSGGLGAVEPDARTRPTPCFLKYIISERAAIFASSGSYVNSNSARARSHAARSGVHAEARRWSTSPPHHLTTLPHHGERNTRTRQRRATLNSAPKRPAICCKIWLVRCNSKRLPRARSLAARSGVLMEARRWCLVAPASYRVCEFCFGNRP